MWNFFILLIFPLYLFSSPSDLNYCCGDGVRISTLSSASSWLRYPSDIPTSEYCTGYGELTSDNRIGSNVSRTVVTYSCGCASPKELVDGSCYSPCDTNQTRINGECIDTLPQSCQSLHGADWLENSASTSENCGSLVDGVNYSNASFHDAYDNYKAVCCVLPVKPSFECSELGDNWSSRSESSETSCNALVDGVTIDSSNYITGDNVAPTCCIHLMPDNNATDPGDNNETTPPTDTNDSNSTPQTLDDAIDQLRNDNNLNASNAQGKYDDLIIGLRDVKENQTQIGEVAHEDAQEIKDAISNEEEEEESENRVSEAQEGNSEILDLGENAIASYTEGFDSLQNIVNGYSAPVISASGSCDLSATIFNRSVSFSTGFASLIPTFRPFVMFILSVSFSLLLIKYTILAWRDVIKFASQTFGR